MDDGSIFDLLRPVYEAFASGRYALMGALLVIVLAAVVKQFVGPKVPWLHGNTGGTVLALVTASATAVATGLAVPGATVTLSLMQTALLVGVTAAGGYAVIKNILVDPVLRPLAAKSPAWAQPLFQLVFWAFDKPDPVTAAVAVGDAAVKAAPGAGVVAVTGAPTDIK